MSASSSLSSRNQSMLRIPLELQAALARRQRERHDYSEKHAALLDLLSRPKKDRTGLCDK